MEPNLPPIDELQEEQLMKYIEHFLDIADFKSIQYGKSLLLYMNQHPDHPKIKTIIRKVVGLFHTDSPAGKVCSLQFIKEAMETNNWTVVETIQKSLLPKIVQIVEYRYYIKNIQRGSTYFISNISKDTEDQEVANLIKLSSTFFRMIHECIYVWGALYFPSSPFDRIRTKLQKRFDFPKFPDQFKFFNPQKVKAFIQNCRQVIQKMAERVDELTSQSSIQKMRENSLKPTRVSNIEKLNRTQSSMQIKNQQLGLKSQKELEKQLNASRKKQTERQQENKQKFSHVPKAKKQQLKEKNKPTNQQTIANNSSVSSQRNSPRKTNSPSKLNATQKQNMQNIGLSSPRKSSLSKQQSAEQAQQNKQLRFKTITEDSDSEGGRYSVKQSSSVYFSSQFSQVQNNNNQQKGKKSTNSERQFNQFSRNNSGAIKRYISEQFIDIPQQPSSLNEQKANQNQLNYPQKQQVALKPSFKKQTKQLQSSPLDQSKQIAQQSNQAQRLKLKQKIPQFKQSLAELQGKRNQIIEENATTSKRQRGSARKSRREQSSTMRKKFIPSSEEEANNESEAQFIEESLEKQYKQNYYQRREEIRKNEQIQKRAIIQKQYNNSQERQQFHQKRPYQAAESKQELEKNKDTFMTQVDTQKTAKTSKPQKIKAKQSSTSIFEGLKAESIIEQTPLPKKNSSQTSKQIKQSNHQQINQQINQSSRHPTLQQEVKVIEAKKQQTVAIAQPVSHKQLLTQLIQEKYQPKQMPEPPHRVQNSIDNENISKKKVIFNQSKHLQNQIAKQNLRTNKIEEVQQIKKIVHSPQPESRKSSSPMNLVQIHSKNDLVSQQDSAEEAQSENQIKPLLIRESVQPQSNTSKMKEQPQSFRQQVSKSRFQKSSQISLTINPSNDIFFELDSRIKQSNQSIKNTIQQQLKEEFNQLKATLLSQQQEHLNSSFQQFKSTILPKPKQKQQLITQCGIQTQPRFKSKIKFHKKKQFVEQVIETLPQSNLNNRKNKIQQKPISNEAQNITLANISNQRARASSLCKKDRNAENEGPFQPNTLLFALYRKKSMNL